MFFMDSFRIPKSCSVFRLCLHLTSRPSPTCAGPVLSVSFPSGEFPSSLFCLIPSKTLQQPVPFSRAFSKSFYCIHPIARTKTFQVSSLSDSFVAAFKLDTCCDTLCLYLWISVFYGYTPSLIIQPRTLKGTASVKDSSKTEQSCKWKIMPQLQVKKGAPMNGLCRLFYCIGCSILCKLCLSTLPLSIYNILPCVTEIQVNLHHPKASISPNPSVDHIWPLHVF